MSCCTHLAGRMAATTATTAVALVALVAPASADVVQSTWTGAVDQSWTDPLNWSPSDFFPNDGAGGDTYLVFIDDAPGTDSMVMLQGTATVSGLTLDLGDGLDVLDGSTLRLAGDATNNGLLRTAAGVSLSQIVVSAPVVMLDGTGEMRLGGSTFDRVTGLNFGNRLVNGPDHAIRGGGLLGNNVIALDNLGTIEASDGLTLAIDPTGSANSNSGLLGAVTGGTLVLQAGAIDNTGGTVRAEAGSEVRIEGGALAGGTVVTVGDGAIRIGNGNAALEDIASSAFIEVENGRTINLSDSFLNDGVIRTAAGASLSQVFVASETLMLDGSGEIQLNGSSFDRISGTNFGFTLAQGADHVIRGGGSLGQNVINIDNAGLVEADIPGSSLDIDPTLTLVNTGIIRARADATMQLFPATYSNLGGLIEAEDGGLVVLRGPAIVDGDVATAGTGLIAVGAGNATLDGVRNLGSIDIENGRSLQLVGVLDNQGAVRTSATGSISQALVASPQTVLAGPGEVRLGGNATLDRLSGTTFGFELVNESPHAIRGGGNVGVNVVNIVNESLIEADDPAGALTIDPTATLVNTGTLRALDGTTMVLLAATYENDGGLIEVADGAEVRFEAPLVVGGDLMSTGSGRFAVGSGNAQLQDLRLDGVVDVENARLVGLAGTIVNDGLIRTNSLGSLSQVSVASDGMTLTGSGELRLGGNATLDRVTGTNFGFLLINDVDHAIRGGGSLGMNVINIENQGIIEADDPGAALSIDPTATLENLGLMRVLDGCEMGIAQGGFVQAGDVVVEPGGAVDRSGTITQTAGTTVVDGTMSIISGTMDIQGGSLRGTGTVEADVLNGGFVQPGVDEDFSVGTLTVDGTFGQAATGTLFIQAGKAGNDRLDVTGVANISGSLLVGFQENFTPVTGTEYVILTADEVEGQFIFANCPVGYVINYGETQVSITITEGISIADLDCNGVVDFEDLLLLLPVYGPCPGGGVPCRADLDASGTVDFNDLLILLGAYG